MTLGVVQLIHRSGDAAFADQTRRLAAVLITGLALV